MTLIVATLLCFLVLLCIGSFKAILAFVSLAALAFVSPLMLFGLVVLLASYFYLTK